MDAESAMSWINILLGNPRTCAEFCNSKFHKHDTNQNGTLELNEVVKLVADVCVIMNLAVPEEDKLSSLFDRYDKNHDTHLSAEEFNGFFNTFIRLSLRELDKKTKAGQSYAGSGNKEHSTGSGKLEAFACARCLEKRKERRERVVITVTTLSGQVAYGPADLPKSTTICELKTLFDAEEKKGLAHGGNILLDTDSLEGLPADATLTVLYCLQMEFGWTWEEPPRRVGGGTPAKKEDDQLKREVFCVDGQMWLEGQSAMDLPPGNWEISLRLKRLSDYEGFRDDVLIWLSRKDGTRMDVDVDGDLEERIPSLDIWTVYRYWTIDTAGGEVIVSMISLDNHCDPDDPGRLMRGLMIDKVVVEPVC